MVPPAILEMLHMESGSAVSMAVESGRLVIEPCLRKKFGLQELLAQGDTLPRHSRRRWSVDSLKRHGQRADLMQRGIIYLVGIGLAEG